MKYLLSLFLMSTLALLSVLRADSDTFLQAGQTYEVEAPKNIALPGMAGVGSTSNDTVLRVIKVSTNQWCLVEYDDVTLPRDEKGESNNKGQVVVYKNRVWFNFAQTTSIRTTSEPDYKGYKDQYAGGVKIVAWQKP